MAASKNVDTSQMTEVEKIALMKELLPAVDVEAVERTRQKYAEEREKRLRSDGNAQYKRLEKDNEYGNFLEDPYTDVVQREPMKDEIDVLVIGGGFGGLLAGARLRDAGVDNIRLLEKGGDFGGTWYWNRYPGAACDVEAYIYLPLLEEMKYTPQKKYTDAPEMLWYSKEIAKKFDLYKNAALSTEVTYLTWNAQMSRWVVGTNRGDEMKARFVIMNNGPLHKPKLPGVPGITEYKGHVFHTSRWDYGYTGGSSSGGMTKLADKRVGFIGTGATAVQSIPHVGETAKQLYVFQRTPSCVDIRNNSVTTPEFAKENLSKPGWHQERIWNYTAVVQGDDVKEDLVNDGFTEISRRMWVNALKNAMKRGQRLTNDEKAYVMEEADMQNMNRIRKWADDVVKDPKTAEALKPYYRQFCKRPCFNDYYLDTFNRPSVKLVDTNGKGVERITEKGIVANGVEYEVDCIIYATGFEVGTEYTRRSGYEVTGRDGLTLSDYWSHGIKTLHGSYVVGFPNLFLEQPVQGAFTPNFTHALDALASQFSAVIKRALDNGAVTVEATQEGQDAWIAHMRKLTEPKPGSAGFGPFGGGGFAQTCTPGYYNNEGQPGGVFKPPKVGAQQPYPLSATMFFNIMKEFKDEGFPGLAFGGNGGSKL